MIKKNIIQQIFLAIVCSFIVSISNASGEASLKPVKLLLLDHGGVLEGTCSLSSYCGENDLDMTNEPDIPMILLNGKSIMNMIHTLVTEYGYTAVSYSANIYQDQEDLFARLKSACQKNQVPYTEMMNSWNPLRGQFIKDKGKDAILSFYERHFGLIDKANSFVFDDGPVNIEYGIAKGYNSYLIKEDGDLMKGLTEVLARQKRLVNAIADKSDICFEQLKNDTKSLNFDQGKQQANPSLTNISSILKISGVAMAAILTIACLDKVYQFLSRKKLQVVAKKNKKSELESEKPINKSEHQ